MLHKASRLYDKACSSMPPSRAKSSLQAMDLLASAYTGEALGNVWKQMRAAWAKDTPTSGPHH